MENTEYEIRPAKLSRAAELAELDRLCFSVPWSLQSFCDELQNPLAVYLVAEKDGRLIGYCGFWSVAGEGQITNICTHPLYRRKGVARALLKEAFRRAAKEKLSLMTLEVRRSNLAARNLYEEFGFSVIGERKRYYSDNGEDAVIMTVYFEDRSR